ncbi:MAG TPA: winged helix-turn-helix domain-containing protein, partial [Acetobacteraceae bacterium]|nr:winged helix-turn-helix domain-containing protein [Acetobacteraceae bacterium]
MKAFDVERSAPAETMAFGCYEVVPQRRELLAEGQPIRLGRRAFDMLMGLIEARGSVVSKDDLMARVWPGQIVEENNIEVQVSALRTAFGPSRHLIRTVFGRGYQFTGDIRPIAASPAHSVTGGWIAIQPQSILPRTNLPEQSCGLIGRDDALREVSHLAASHRFVTLTGFGGIGKTRLALAVARQLMPQFPDGVWLADCSSVADPGGTFATIAAALGVELPSAAISAQCIAQRIAGRQLLLVLDTCEHVIAPAAELAEAVLRIAPGVRIIATSREPLNVEGEQIYQVRPLAVPPEHAEGDDDLLRHGAARLFLERAHAAQAYCSPDQSAAAIAAICRRLDGVPLAIELAAARVKLLPPEVILPRLEHSLGLLTGGSRDLPDRQQTLRGTIAWSYDLLTEGARRLLATCSVFAGGATLEVIETICAAAVDIGLPVLDGLQ